jgi:hypothetical protein
MPQYAVNWAVDVDAGQVLAWWIEYVTESDHQGEPYSADDFTLYVRHAYGVELISPATAG